MIRNDRNPFLSSLRVPTATRGLRIPQRDGSVVDLETGEQLHTQATVKRPVDADVFVKIFINELGWLAGMGPRATRALVVLLDSMCQQPYGGRRDLVPVGGWELKDFLGRIPAARRAGYSPSSLSRGLRELETRGLIVRASRRPWYWVDPSKIFVGNRLKIEYERRRDTNVLGFPTEITKGDRK